MGARLKLILLRLLFCLMKIYRTINLLFYNQAPRSQSSHGNIVLNLLINFFQFRNGAQVGGKKSIFRYAINLAFRFDVSFCDELREQSTIYS